MGMNRKLSGMLAVLTVGLATLAFAGSASASFHLMKIRAIFKGPVDASFVELQMTAGGQNFTSGHTISFYDDTGALVHSSPVFTNVAQGDSQRTILIGDISADGSPDFEDPQMYETFNADTSGAVCWENIDCVAYGAGWEPAALALLPSPAGTPVSGLSTTQVIARNIDRGCTTALDDADDSNDSAADFGFVVGFPLRNNSVAPTETLCTPPPTVNPPATPAPKKKKCKKKKKRSATAQIAKKCKKKRR
jgi:hypothetical protein